MKPAPSITSRKSARERGRRAERVGRHVSARRAERFPATFLAFGDLALDGAVVSASASDLSTGEPLLAIDERVVLPAAHLGTVLLLIEVSARLTNNDGSGYGNLDKISQSRVGDSGIWQHLQASSLPISDLATLVGSSNDNLATNLLVQRVGLEAIRWRAETLGLTRTALLDIVRDVRGPDMVASAFGLDPLAHRHEDHEHLLVNKTGSDLGVRVEAGVLRGTRAEVSYAVTVAFEETTLASRLRVLGAMRTVGEELLDYVN